jgi:hypothetical protein
VCKRRERARKHDVIAPKKEGITHSRGVMGFTRTHLAVMVEKMVRKKAEKRFKADKKRRFRKKSGY